MRICFISHTARLGGAERILLETIEVFREQGIECRVILPGLGEFSRSLRARGIPFATLPVPWWMSRSDPSWLSRMKSAASNPAGGSVFRFAGSALEMRYRL